MEQPKILVAIRKRPLSKKQISKGESDIVSVKSSDTVIISEYKQKVDLTKFLQETIFNFDFAFHEETQNQEIYDLAVRPLVDSAFQGAKVTCFAYGQTGSGKTHTMNGNLAQGIPGLYTLGANDIFEYLSSPQFRHLKAKLSFYEIYCGKLFDLLNKRQQLKLREDNKNNINIIGLQQAAVSTSEEFIDYLSLGSQQRVTSQNSANADSSRSHAILQISIKDGKKLHGKISFIDLAGNQRGADHMDMDKQTRIDGAQINKSLLSLKQCIRALDQGKGHTPFRGSKLTMVLKDSFVGFCRTVMIGNVSPSSASSENTLNTLRYADRVKQLRKPQQGGGSKQDQKAKQMMLPRQNKNAIRIMINNDDDADDIARKRDEAQKQYGITEQISRKQPQNIQKQQVNPRKNSFGGQKLNQYAKQQNLKSNSLAKNLSGLGSKQPLTNNLVNPNIFNKQQLPTNGGIGVNKQKMVNDNGYEYSNRTQQTLNRYNSSNQNPMGRRQEPMQIQSPSTTPYYVPNSNKNQGPKLFTNNNTGKAYNQPSVNNYSGMMNQSQNVTSNYSNLNGNNPNNQFFNNYQQPGMRGQNQYINFPNNNNSGIFNSNYSNYPQNNYQGNNNGVFLSARGPVHSQQQMYQLPEKWQDMVSTVSNSVDPRLNEAVLSEMNKRLYLQEDELMKNHSETLRSEIDMIKSQMGLLNEMQIDKSKITSRGYVRFMQQSIQDKISILQMLRERLINFTYKLDEMEEIEGKGRTGNIDDEQLLDDIN